MELRIKRLQANAELQRIIAALSGYLSGRQYRRIPELFAEEEEIWASMPWGTYRGQEGLERLFDGLYRALYGDEAGRPGLLTVHGANTPVITVGADCRTAWGSWISPGVFTLQEDGAPNGLRSYWAWQKIFGVFVREETGWKIRRLQVTPLFTTAFEKNWAETQSLPWNGIPAEFAPDGPPEEVPPAPDPAGIPLAPRQIAPWDRSDEARVTRLELAAEAQRLMGVYAEYLSSGRFDEIPGLFALETPTVRAELLSGVYAGPEEIRNAYAALLPAGGTILEGVQSLETPVIRAAGDCQTVKGVWVSPGYRTIRLGDGTPAGVFAWRKYAADFVVTRDGLRIWHLHEYGLFDSVWGSGEIRTAGVLEGTLTLPAGTPPTTPFSLSEDSVYPYEPAVPRQYGVYDPDYGY